MARPRPEQDRRSKIVDAICVVVVLLALAGLVAWVVFHHGGGVLNHG